MESLFSMCVVRPENKRRRCSSSQVCGHVVATGPGDCGNDGKAGISNDINKGGGGGGGYDDNAVVARQTVMVEMHDFAGEKLSCLSGDSVGLAKTQLFAWDAKKKLGIEGAGVHVQADPNWAELMRHKFKSRGLDMKERKRQAALDWYDGEEYLDATSRVVGCGVAGRSLSAPLDIGVGGGGGGGGGRQQQQRGRVKRNSGGTSG